MDRLLHFLAGLDHGARRVLRNLAHAVAQDREAHDLVDRHPVVDPVAEPLDGGRDVIGKILGHLAAPPGAVAVLQGLRAVPVQQRGMGRDAVLQERVDQAAVEIDAFLVHRPASVRHDPRPGDAEAIVLDAQVGHQLHVVLVAVVVIAGDVARVAAVGAAGGVAEGVPDARLAAVFRRGAFDLVGRGGRSPPETLGKPGFRRFRRRLQTVPLATLGSIAAAVPSPAQVIKSLRCMTRISSIC